MALSKSIIRAQDIMMCQLCEADPKVQFKCLDCDLMYCNKCCERVHSKIKHATRHNIMHIYAVGNSVLPAQMDFRNIPCTSHPEQFCCLYCVCKTCEKLVCPTCIAKEHTGHNLNEFQDIYTVLLNKLNEAVSEIEVQEKEIDAKETEIIRFKENEMEMYSQLQKELETKRQTYKNDIDTHFDILAADVNFKIDKMQTSAGDASTCISASRENLTAKQKRTETLQRTRDASEFFNSTPIFLTNIRSEIPVVNLPLIKTLLKFEPKYEQLPGELLGAIKEEKKHVTKKNLELKIEEKKDVTKENLELKTEEKKHVTKKNLKLKIKNQYSTELDNCHFIAAFSGGSYFIAQSKENQCVLTKVHIDRDSIETIFTKKALVTDIENPQASTNSILLADNTPSLKVVDRLTGKFSESQYQTGSLNIIAVHVTIDNKVVVGARSPGDLFPVQGRRVVIVMDSEGKRQAEWEYNQRGDRLFSSPRPSASVQNGNIFVKDRVSSDGKGKVIILSPTGDVLNTYTGHPDINNRQTPFAPAGMTQLSSDNVIVCDYNANALHVLNDAGVPLSYFSTLSIGIKYPYCVTVDTVDRDVLLIGCTNSGGSIEKGKLYTVNFMEF